MMQFTRCTIVLILRTGVASTFLASNLQNMGPHNKAIELLCFFISKFSNEQSEALKKVILSFYTASEISVAKELYDLSNDLTEDPP